MKKNLVFLFLILSFLLSFSAFSQNESITITTFYPSPAGIYQQLTTSTLGVGDNDGSGSINAADAPDPAVASQNGDVWVAGDVGIKTGTNGPRRTLHVAGMDGMRLESSVRPSTPATGDIVIDSSDNNALKWYNGSAWSAAGGGSCYLANFPYVHTMSSAGTGVVASSANCLTGFTDQGSVGEYGVCWYPGSDFSYYMPPGSKCDDGYASGYVDKPYYIGQGHLCCK